MSRGKTISRPQSETEKKPTSGGRGGGCRTVLFNDDVHTFDEVAVQLVRAIRCTFSRGMALANAVHHLGSAIVYEGHLERCEAVAAVLEEIRLRTKVER
ncbi:MAG: ATP-dependent Clp protease adaptor ClpS [Elusimicrobia bacterium]|nr:ATP-dependent Clp protease adaptor ClpS [Elusimicrobiota bacterium]